MTEFEIKKIEELKKKSDDQDELIFKLRKKLARVEKSILGYSLDSGDNGKER